MRFAYVAAAARLLLPNLILVGCGGVFVLALFAFFYHPVTPPRVLFRLPLQGPWAYEVRPVAALLPLLED